MNRYVVDASVAIKWFFPEEFSEHAGRLLSSSNEIIFPDLVISEIGNILWKYIARGECALSKAIGILRQIQSPALHIWRTAIIAEDALVIACRTKRTFYDSLYVALAVRNNCQMVTADLNFYNALKDTPLKKHLLWIEDIPL